VNNKGIIRWQTEWKKENILKIGQANWDTEILDKILWIFKFLIKVLKIC